MDEFALERFWRRLDDFVKAMVAWANDVDPASIQDVAPGADFVISSPDGHAYDVWHAIQRVDDRALEPGEAALFTTAARQFDLLCRQHGFDGADDDTTWDAPPDCGSVRFRAIETMVAKRLALPFPSPAAGQGRDASIAGRIGDAQAGPAGSPVVLGDFGDRPIVHGHAKPSLTRAQHDVVRVLLAAGDGGMTGDDLKRISGHGDAVKILGRLRDADADWAAAIRMPGRSWGGGYRIQR